MDHKFSLSIRIDRETPAHVYVSVFSGMINADIDHKNATRGKAGELVMRTDEFGEFLNRVQPDILTAPDGVDLERLERKSPKTAT